MIRRTALLFSVGIMAAGMILAGCSKPPTEEINAAQAVIDSVKALPEVGAYAADQVTAVEATMADVQAKVAEKKYDEARQALQGLADQARAIVATAAANKEAKKGTSEMAIADANTALAAADQKIAKMPKRGAKAATPEMKAQLQAGKDAVAAAQAAFDAGDFATAAAKSGEAKAAADALNPPAAAPAQ
jgi:small-conductance mechanosensitive channel